MLMMAEVTLKEVLKTIWSGVRKIGETSKDKGAVACSALELLQIVLQRAMIPKEEDKPFSPAVITTVCCGFCMTDLSQEHYLDCSQTRAFCVRVVTEDGL